MKIGIACHPTHGGSGVVATELGKSLARRGHSVHFITYDVPFRLHSLEKNISVHRVKTPHYAAFKYPPHDLALANLMAKVASRYRLDVIHVHYAIPYSICAFLAKQIADHDFYVVTTLHGTDVTILGETPSLKKMIEFGINHSDAVTAVSNSLIEQTNNTFQIERPIQLIYNFVDLSEYNRQKRQDVSQKRLEFATPQEKILLHVSNFRPVKRVKDVVSVFNLIQKQIPAKLLLVGEGPELPSVKEYVDELGLTSKVLFLGKQNEVASLYSLADLFIIPSEKESFGLVAIEAMACGVPVIGSEAGGLPEVIKHGETGYLSPIGDVEDMAKHALHLLENPALHRLFSLRGLKRVKQLFSLKKIVSEYEALYRSFWSGGGVYSEQEEESFYTSS